MKRSKRIFSIVFLFALTAICHSCKNEVKTSPLKAVKNHSKTTIDHAKGFTMEKMATGVTLLKVNSPWPDAEHTYTYALVPKSKMAHITMNADAYDAIIYTPVDKIVVTSTTHIPALDALNVLDHLVGFPNTDFVSSKKARSLIDKGTIKDLGNNETLNPEMTLALKPDVVIGFGINDQNKGYNTLQRARIPVVYNGDWTERTPLGKAEWIKFFAAFFDTEKTADSLFREIETNYEQAKNMAKNVKKTPTVLSGGLYKDVWYVAGGKSWMAAFLNDANTNYLWRETKETGSIPLSVENVLERGTNAEFWLNPSMHTSYSEMKAANRHYGRFDAFKNEKVFSNAIAKGPTGGLLFYELAPQRPDLVLKDLIAIFHPTVLPDHQSVFFKPLH